MLHEVKHHNAELMVATHNQSSIEQAVLHMNELNIQPHDGVYFGQLLGMADQLTYTLGAHGFKVWGVGCGVWGWGCDVVGCVGWGMISGVTHTHTQIDTDNSIHTQT